jgi:hypothetical protein
MPIPLALVFALAAQTPEQLWGTALAVADETERPVVLAAARARGNNKEESDLFLASIEREATRLSDSMAARASVPIRLQSDFFSVISDGRVRIGYARQNGRHGITVLWRNIPERMDGGPATEAPGNVTGEWLGAAFDVVVTARNPPEIMILADAASITAPAGPNYASQKPTSFVPPSMTQPPTRVPSNYADSASLWSLFMAGRAPRLEVPREAVFALAPSAPSNNEFERLRQQQAETSALDEARKSKQEQIVFTIRPYRVTGAEYDFKMGAYRIPWTPQGIAGLSVVAPGQEVVFNVDPILAEREFSGRLAESGGPLVWRVTAKKLSARSGAEVKKERLRHARGVFQKMEIEGGTFDSELELSIQAVELVFGDGTTVGSARVQRSPKKPK